VYFKALPPGLEHEVALTARLAAWFPSTVMPVLAADEARGWMLLPDGGPRLRDAGLRPGEMASNFRDLLAEYARMQVVCAGRVEELLVAGVPDRRLRHATVLIDKVLELAEGMLHLDVEPLTQAEMRELTAMRPWLLEAAERLDGMGLPETIQHDDLHDGNVLLGRGGPRIFDWGDASISHPFLSLRVPLQNVAELLDVPLSYGTPEIVAALAAYFAPWRENDSDAALLEAYRLSMPVAVALRILTWDLALTHAGEGERGTDADFVVKLLRELLGIARGTAPV
jgi:hypothetical protein